VCKIRQFHRNLFRSGFGDYQHSLHDHVSLGVGLGVAAAVGDETSQDEVVLHFLELVGVPTGVLVVHVPHALVGGQLETVTVPEGPAAGSECAIVAHLYLFYATVEHAYMMARSPELGVQVAEGSHHLTVIHGDRNWNRTILGESIDECRECARVFALVKE